MDLAFCSDSAFFPQGSMFLGFCRGVFGCCPCNSLLSTCGRGCAFEVGGEWKQELASCSWFLLCSTTYSLVIFSSPFWKFVVSCLKIASRERGLIAYQDRPSPAVLFQLLPVLEVAVLELWAPCKCLCPLSSRAALCTPHCKPDLVLFFLLDLFWTVRLLFTRLSVFLTSTFFPEQVSTGEAVVAKLPELLAVRLSQLLHPWRLCRS